MNSCLCSSFFRHLNLERCVNWIMQVTCSVSVGKVWHSWLKWLFQQWLHLKPAHFLTWIITVGPHRLWCGSQFAAHSSFFFFFYGRSVLVVTVEPWEFSTPTGWVKTPPTSFSRWFWSTPSTKPSGVTQTPNGSQSLCTSTERCAGWHPRERRAAAWARATSSTWPSEAPAALPGRGATPCSCTATVRACHLSVHSRNKHPFYGDSCFLFHNLY